MFPQPFPLNTGLMPPANFSASLLPLPSLALGARYPHLTRPRKISAKPARQGRASTAKFRELSAKLARKKRENQREKSRPNLPLSQKNLYYQYIIILWSRIQKNGWGRPPAFWQSPTYPTRAHPETVIKPAQGHRTDEICPVGAGLPSPYKRSILNMRPFRMKTNSDLQDGFFRLRQMMGNAEGEELTYKKRRQKNLSSPQGAS